MKSPHLIWYHYKMTQAPTDNMKKYDKNKVFVEIVTYYPNETPIWLSFYA